MAIAIHRFVCPELESAFSDVIDESFKNQPGTFSKNFWTADISQLDSVGF